MKNYNVKQEDSCEYWILFQPAISVKVFVYVLTVIKCLIFNYDIYAI